jgi:fatty acid desaturase
VKPRRDPYKEYRSRLLTPEQVKKLSALRPGRVVVDTLLCWVTIVAAWTSVAIYNTWWMTLLAIPVIGSRFYALFIIGHDGLHGRLFEKRERNNWFNDICIMGAIGAITRINNKNHLLHHLNLANHDDPDRHKHGCFNKADHFQLFVYLLGMRSVLKTARNVFIKNARTANTKMAESPKPSYTKAELLLLFCWQVALITSLTYFIGWWGYPILWLFPVYAFSVLGDNLRSFAEHSTPESDAKADEHRLITYFSNPLELWFVAPMNMNFHTAHHLWVSIPYYNLPEADRLIRQSPNLEGLEWRGTYLGYLLRYHLALPLPECRPTSV